MEMNVDTQWILFDQTSYTSEDLGIFLLLAKELFIMFDN